MLRAALALAAAACASAAAPTFLNVSSFTFAPPDRWAPRSFSGGTSLLSKWGSATAIVASPVGAVAPPHATALGLVYGTGSSNGHVRVSVNGALIAEVDTFSRAAANYSNEFIVNLTRPIISLPLWVLSAEATGRWTAGSKDSFIEIVGVNVYY